MAVTANPPVRRPVGARTIPTSAEVVAAARAMVPELVRRQEETEQRTFYAQDTHDAFTEAGFYRILVPRRYGGHELGISTFVQVALALTRGCPSTGWMYCLGAAHALAVATLFDERAQDDIFTGPDFIAPATVGPSGTARQTGDGDWILDGTWGYCSGAPYATHFIGHTLVPSAEDGSPEPLLFIAPRSEWRRKDDWGGTLGLRGSGSHSITMDGARIPAHLARRMHLSQITVLDGTPGQRLHGNPMYGGGSLSFMVMEDALLAVGMAQGALDAYEELMRTRSTVFPPIQDRADDPDYQFRYGKAAGMIATAEAALLQLVHQWEQGCADPANEFTPEREMRYATVCREIVHLCWRAVESHLIPTAGSSAVRGGARVERIWRDMTMLHSHAGVGVFLSGIAQREYAKARFGRH